MYQKIASNSKPSHAQKKRRWACNNHTETRKLEGKKKRTPEKGMGEMEIRGKNLKTTRAGRDRKKTDKAGPGKRIRKNFKKFKPRNATQVVPERIGRIEKTGRKGWRASQSGD